MSFWDNIKKFTQPYADDEYDEYEEEDELEGYEEEIAEPTRSGRNNRRPNPFKLNNEAEETFEIDTTPAAAPAAPAPSAPIGFSGKVVPNNSNKQEVVLFHPSSFNDTSKAADDLRSKKVVILNLENVDKAMARRVVDFLSGCSYALDGKVRKVAQSTYLFCPYSMDVVGDLENLQSEVESYI